MVCPEIFESSVKPSPLASHASLEVFWPNTANPSLLSSDMMDALMSVVLWNAEDPLMDVVVCEMFAEFLTGSFVMMLIVHNDNFLIRSWLWVKARYGPRVPRHRWR